MASFFDVSNTLVHGGLYSRASNLPSSLSPSPPGQRNMFNLLTPNTLTADDSAVAYHVYDGLTLDSQTSLSFGIPMACEGDVIGYAYEMMVHAQVTTPADQILIGFNGLIGPNKDNAYSGLTTQYRPIIPTAIGGTGSTAVHVAAKGVFAFNRQGTAYPESNIWIGYTAMNLGPDSLSIDVGASIAIRRVETGPSIWSQTR